jgi:hypothetical protein
MATFVRVARNQSGVVIFVNMDKVILMERTQKSYTILKPNNADFTSELVNERAGPGNLHRMISGISA